MADTIRDQLVTFFAEQGLTPGSDLHSWRCQYPDRYGECDCVAVLIDDLLSSSVVARIRAEAWDEGHRASRRHSPDDGCTCGAWSAGECACGKYGTGALTSLADNPYREATDV